MSANAQVWIGGGLGAEINNVVKRVNVAPEIGYNINNQWTIALGADYTFNNQWFTTLGDHEVTGTTNTLFLEPYVRYVGGTIGKKFSLFCDLTGDFGLVDAGGYAVMLRPGIAWAATEQFTAAFRLGKIGYDHGIYGTNGFLMDCYLVAPEIRLYYSF